MAGVSKNCWVTLASGVLIIILSSLKLFSSLKVSVSGLTIAWPRAALPHPLSLGSKYQLELYRKALIKSLLFTSVSPLFCWSRKCWQELAALGCVVSGHLSPVLFTWFLWRRHFETLSQFAKWSHVHQTHTGWAPAPAPHPLLSGHTPGDIHYYHPTLNHLFWYLLNKLNLNFKLFSPFDECLCMCVIFRSLKRDCLTIFKLVARWLDWRWPIVHCADLCVGGGGLSVYFVTPRRVWPVMAPLWPLPSVWHCLAWARCWPTRKLESNSNYPDLITDIRTRHFVYHSPFTLFTRSIRWK